MADVVAGDALASLLWLIGDWAGEGRGAYPTIAEFDYREEATFTQPRPDKPFLRYSQQTWLLSSGEPSHAEVGYVRAVAPQRAELVVALPSGVVELHDGTVTPDGIDFSSRLVGCTATAKSVTAVRRMIGHRGDDTLWYRLDMAAVGRDAGYHCEATLHRVG